ncbi:MAG: relaxase/mobilization nuclease and DUF3363 domain-containing protein [Roseitalea porphyridii]|jgi:type IV secretory pathway VirD2 relaxase|uniref:relaxase/mobilization nuclease and DUF3363 domain-containing protein n=1 Tax=Pseudomonadota TaxID=1224 RepID=UPI0032EDD318
MAAGSDDEFRIKLGKPRSAGSGRAKRHVNRVLKAISKAGYGGFGRRVSRSGVRYHRGAAAARFAGGTGNEWGRARRVVIKTRIVKLTRSGAKAAALHLRYIQRDGVDRDGEPGRLYSAREDEADGKAFAERGAGDRHQFRFIVSPEDAGEMADLRAFTRDLMAQVETDLGTKLDWVSVDHFNTDNPHTHVVLRGVTDEGKTLIIDRDYITHGMRTRASDLATLELGPQTDHEIETKLRREVDQERWTRIDRAMTREAVDGVLDVRERPRPDQAGLMRRMMVGRVQALQRMELAIETSPGVWMLDANRETILRRMGERSDIIKTLHRTLGKHVSGYSVFDEPADGQRTVVGRIADKGFADELRDRHYLIVDGVDGRGHYVAIGTHPEFEDLKPGMIVSVGGSDVGPRPADRAVAAIAKANGGIYDPDRHLAAERARPGADGRDPEAFVQSHVRRLEALRRAGIAERLDDGRWRVPEDLLERTATYEAERSRGRPPVVEVLSAVPIEMLPQSEGATWLDRQLVGRDPVTLTETGFGRVARNAMEKRVDHLVGEGFAERRGKQVLFARNLLDTLRRRELASVAAGLEDDLGVPYRDTKPGDKIAGLYRRSLMLASGRHALIENAKEFTLVPWRPVLERRLGQEVAGVARGTNVSWTLGRSRGPSVG